MYSNDLATNVNYTIRMFSDDFLIYRTISTADDNLLLQSNLNYPTAQPPGQVVGHVANKI